MQCCGAIVWHNPCSVSGLECKTLCILWHQWLADTSKPAVSSDCTVNFWVGDSYCVGVSTSSTRTGMTRPDKPTQTGISGTCNLFYDVITGDTCSAIEQSFDITHGQFIAWNVSHQYTMKG